MQASSRVLNCTKLRKLSDTAADSISHINNGLLAAHTLPYDVLS